MAPRDLMPGNGPNPAIDAWLLWQLVDSAFPTGGFAHSAGLEAAWQQGEVRGRTELTSFIESNLAQLGHGQLPLMLAAHAEPENFTAWDDLCEVFTTNHVANRASRAQGRAFLSALERIYKPAKLPAASAISYAHFAPAFGLGCHTLDINRDMAGRMLFHNQLRSLLAAAVRLNIVGPMEAQILQHQLAARAEFWLTECATLTVNDITQTSPLLDLWQGAQDRLYSRLFQS